MNNHCMIDIETLNTTPDSLILSIGAVAFSPFDDKITSEFYKIINLDDCVQQGLSVDEGTVNWWKNQSDEAQEIIKLAKESTSDLRSALTEFSKWFTDNKLKYLWACSPSFDAVVMRNAYSALNMNPTWKYWDELDYRTVRTLNPSIEENERIGTYHNALDDCKHQTEHLQKIFRGNK